MPNSSDLLVAIPPIHPASFETLEPGRRDEIFLYLQGDTRQPRDDHYRYKLTVLDRKLLPTTRLSHATAVFLIPAGRETEFMFYSHQGLQSIAESAQTARLVAVSFGRMHHFVNQQTVQEELTFVIQVLARQGNFLPKANRLLNNQAMIPFMALDGVGKRNVIAQGESVLSGKYIVEQVQADGQQVRRLYFLDNPFVIQSEVILMAENESSLTRYAISVDKSKAAFEYHKAIVAGILSLSTTSALDKGILIGLGGGGLVNFLQYCLPNLHLHVVELDPEVARIAQAYFGVDKPALEHEPGKWSLHIGDGLAVSCSSGQADASGLYFAPESMDFIMIDVDSKDRSVGMACPPQPFIEPTYLQQIHSVLVPNGILAVNLSARDPKCVECAFRNVAAVFPSVFLIDGYSDSNGDESLDEEREDLNIALLATRSSTILPRVEDRITALKSALARRDDSLDAQLVSDLKAICEDISVWNNNENAEQKATKKSKRKRGKKKKK